MIRKSQRDVFPVVIKNRGFGDIVQVSSNVTGSETLAAGGEVTFIITTKSIDGVRIIDAGDIALYESSVADANRIPGGSNITAGDYQIIGPFNDWGTTDGNNVKTHLFVRNTTSTTDFSKRVAAQDDDGYDASGSWNTTDVILSFGAASGPTSITNAVRFNNVTIPNGETINSATLTFNPNVSDTSDVNTKIYGIDEDDTADFSSDPTGRTKTSANVDWDFTSTTQDVVEVSPDISTVVKEIVDRGGWSSGNDMGFLILNDNTPDNTPDDDFNTFDSYDGDSAKAPLLDVNYGTGSSKTVLLRARSRAILNKIIA